MGPMVHIWVNINMHYSGPRSRRKREKGTKSLFKETLTENFPSLERDKDIQTYGAQSPQAKSVNKLLWHIIIKLWKVKDKEKI